MSVETEIKYLLEILTEIKYDEDRFTLFCGDDRFVFGSISPKGEDSPIAKSLQYKTIYDTLIDINRKIAELDFSVRTYNVLTKAGYSTVRELLDADPDDIIKLPNLGLKSFSEIIDVLGEKGFEWKSGKICKSYSRIKVCKDEN